MLLWWGSTLKTSRQKQALLDAKDKHARRWQTKKGTYRLKGKLLPDVRDTDVEMADISTGPQQSDHSKQAWAWQVLLWLVWGSWTVWLLAGVQPLRALRMKQAPLQFTIRKACVVAAVCPFLNPSQVLGDFIARVWPFNAPKRLFSTCILRARVFDIFRFFLSFGSFQAIFLRNDKFQMILKHFLIFFQFWSVFSALSCNFLNSGISRLFFFFCSMLHQRKFVVRAVALLSAGGSEKRFICDDFNKLCI